MEFGGQICTAPLPPAFMRGVPEGRGEYRTWMQKSFHLEAIGPDFWLKRHPGWVGSSPPSMRTGVLPSQAREARTQARQSAKHQFILQNRYLFSPVSSGAGDDGIAKRTETHWQRALPAKHKFAGLQGRVARKNFLGRRRRCAV